METGLFFCGFPPCRRGLRGPASSRCQSQERLHQVSSCVVYTLLREGHLAVVRFQRFFFLTVAVVKRHIPSRIEDRDLVFLRSSLRIRCLTLVPKGFWLTIGSIGKRVFRCSSSTPPRARSIATVFTLVKRYVSRPSQVVNFAFRRISSSFSLVPEYSGSRSKVF